MKLFAICNPRILVPTVVAGQPEFRERRGGQVLELGQEPIPASILVLDRVERGQRDMAEAFRDRVRLGHA